VEWGVLGMGDQHVCGSISDSISNVVWKGSRSDKVSRLVLLVLILYLQKA
jgi:hypothetical protein